MLIYSMILFKNLSLRYFLERLNFRIVTLNFNDFNFWNIYQFFG